MKKALFFEQEKPLTVKILGAVLLLIALWFILNNSGPLNQVVVMSLLGLILIGSSVSFEITSDFNNKRHFKLFGLSVFKSKLETAFPDYMVVFSAKFKQGAEWGPVGALGKQRQGDSFVIRFFKGNRHFTLYKNKSMEKAKAKAVALSELIGVEIRGKK